jgi:excisionase family DNA binding protein
MSFQTLLDAKQAASLLGCHPRTLLRKAREGAVPCFHVFGKVRFTEASLSEWVEAQGYNQNTIRAA